nr:sensor histidine kinase [Lachnoclostridium sp. Marseille-P6806]
MRKLAAFLNNRSLRTQLFICFIIILVPITFVLTLVLFRLASGVISRKTEEQAHETVQQLSNVLDNYLTLMTNKLDILGNSPVIQEELTASGNEVNRNEDYFYSRSKQIRRMMLQEYSSINMNDMEVVGLNGAEYYLSVSNKSSDYDKEELEQMADRSQGKWVLYNEDGTLMLAKLIKELQTAKPLGYVRFSLKRPYIEKLTNNIGFGSNGSVIILDSSDHVLSGEMDEELEEKYRRMSGAKGSFEIRMRGMDYLAIYVRSSDSGWTTIGLIPNDDLYRDLRSFRNTVLGLMAMMTAACIGLARVLGRSFVHPIEDTEKALERFSTGDFSVRLREDRQDEIGQMNRMFNKTVADVQSLTYRVAQADILAREMEYKTLQSQMNPHFLYNTLDVINWMAFKKDETDICNMVNAVSNLMRISISNKQAIISLEQELGYVKDYLYIQHIRYGNRFETIYDVDEALLSQMIPKLIVQPIVENAVVHGIESAEGMNIITVTVKRVSENDIGITIEDTGIGMSQEKIDSLLEDQKAEKENDSRYHTNLGIYAVNKRIKFLYGDTYGLKISSKPGIQTTVEIHIPYMENPEELHRKYYSMLGEQNK